MFCLFGGIALDSFFQDARRSRAAPVTLKVSELHGNHAFDHNAAVRIQGTYRPGVSFQVGAAHYFVLADGNLGILVGPSRTAPDPIGRLNRLPSELKKALASHGRLGDVEIVSDRYLDPEPGVEPSDSWKWGAWSCALLSGLALLLMGLSFARRHVIFCRTGPDMVSPPSDYGPGEIRCTGLFRLGTHKERFYDLPVALMANPEDRQWCFAAQVDASRSMYGQIVDARVGLWGLILPADSLPSEPTPGLLYGWGAPRLALRFQCPEPVTGRYQTIYLSFDGAEDREAWWGILRGSLPEPVTEPQQPEAAAQPEEPAVEAPEPEPAPISVAPAPTACETPPSSFFTGALGGAAAAILAGIGVGAAYGMISQYIELLVISQLLAGLLLGGLGGLLLIRFHARHPVLIVVLMILAGTVAVATRYTLESQLARPAMVEGFSQRAPRSDVEALLTPWRTLMVYLHWRAETGLHFGDSTSDKAVAISQDGQTEEVRPGGDTHFVGRGFWFYILAETALLAVMAAVVAVPVLRQRPYCGPCRRWLQVVARLTSNDQYAGWARERIETRKWAELRQLPPLSGQEVAALQLILHRCPACNQRVLALTSRSFPGANVTVVVDEEDERELCTVLRIV